MKDTRVRTEKSIVYEILSGEIEGVAGAAIGYLDDAMLEGGLDSDVIKKKYLENLPFIGGVLEVAGVGRLATIILPRFQSEVFEDQEQLLLEIDKAIRLSAKIGAKCVSLTGLIPSATSHGEAIKNKTKTFVTTGHATTTACIVLNVRKTLEVTSKTLETSTLIAIGLGSIGTAAIRLCLSVLPHPTDLVFIDVKSKKSDLECLVQEVQERLNYSGSFKILISDGKTVPNDVYSTRNAVILGATNVGGILDTNRLHPGTVIIDDSAPHLFNPSQMWDRMGKTHDVLATEAGPLTLPTLREERIFTPTRWVGSPDLLPPPPDPSIIMGCTLSCLLTANSFEKFPPQLGTVRLEESVAHYEKLLELGCTGCMPNIDDVMVGEECWNRI
eukprot:TRINITY_DN2206_c2_g1_i1.p1 TRINITY_DN2206_c2_g1~~TRINITY_DN2206_c2_g1_i1.p1  ORF type:complete len:405 (+),score=44.13 TRINITY_DN2206_c2_g1_i1:60-1217(+)